MGLRRVIALLWFSLALTLAACEGLAGEPRIVATIPPQSISDAASTGPEDIAAVMVLGGEVWMANCAACHGQTGEGTAQGAPLPDLANHTDEQILASITNGNDIMPAFGELLTPEELNAAMTYAKMMSLARSRGMIGDSETASDSAAEAAANPAAPAENAVLGSVAGQVTNGTEGAALPADLPVTLHVVKSEFTEESFEVPANPDGSFVIEGVPFDSTYQYVVTAAYGDLLFASEILTADPTVPQLTLPMTIYESGAPESAIQISGISAQVMAQNNVMQIIQIVSFANTSDRVYFNMSEDTGTSVRLNMPQNASLLSGMNSRYILSDDGRQIYSTRPVMPGESHIMHIAYSMPYNQSAAVDQVFDYPLSGAVEVVLATNGLTLAGDDFAEPQQVSLGNQPMLRYSGQVTREAGARLRYDVSGVPAVVETNASASTTSVVISPIAYILIGAGVASLLIAGIITLRERSTSRRRSSKATISDLMEQIAALDAQHEEGKLNTRDYERQRTALKAQLKALMKTQ